MQRHGLRTKWEGRHLIMELLFGAATSDTRGKIWGTRPLFDYQVAADFYVRCRRSGFTPANSNDLLVAAVVIGRKVPLLAADSDFERIAAVPSLRLHASLAHSLQGGPPS